MSEKISTTPASSSSAPTPPKTDRLNTILLMAAIIMVAINLRPALIAVGPLVDTMRASLGLSSAAFGVLMTLPVLCFGVFAPFAPRLLRYWSPEHIILANMVLLGLGLVWRSASGVIALFGGTLVAGLSISVIMVLLPSIIKRHFAAHASLMMGVYTTALALGATVAAGITVPFADVFGGWRWALGIWFVPAVFGFFAWWRWGPAPERISANPNKGGLRLARNWLAWQVTLYMGLQGAIAYSVFGWLPLILVDRGLSERDSGYVLAVMMFVQLWSSIAGPWLAMKGRDQRPTVLLMLGFVSVGWLCFMYGAIDYVWVWAVIFGLGFGGMFSLAMVFLVLRAPDPAAAAALSGMAQGAGYTVSAMAPLFIGVLHDLTHSWHSVSAFMILLMIGTLWAGLLAGRAKLIS